MNRQDLIEIAKDTIKYTDELIRETGVYQCEDVEVYSPKLLEEIENDDDKFFERSFLGTDGASVYVVNADSFEAASWMDRPLVMNFANAHRPGGGFLNGARAQEESLCRCSTLYKSISSDRAREMYDYNNTHNNPCDSDYMLLSPHVVVLRNRTCELLDSPYEVAVVTIPAPNRGGRASNVPQDILDEVMTERLRKMFYLAARRGYRNLVLGAWGCGAFGNDTRKVAEYFYNLIYSSNKFQDFFDNIVFAILGDEDKIATFRSVFGDKVTDGYPEGYYGEQGETCYPKYFVTDYEYPVCNHTLSVDKSNIGFARGVTATGVPFEAEVDEKDGVQSMAVVLPVLHTDNENKPMSEKLEEITAEKSNSNVIGMRCADRQYDISVIDMGMTDDGMEDDFDYILGYVEFLDDSGIVNFTTDMRNGAVFYRTDVAGNSVAKVVITLREDGNTLAWTGLKLQPFPRHDDGVDKSRFRVFR